MGWDIVFVQYIINKNRFVYIRICKWDIVYVEGFAQDGYCSNTMRSLTDKEVIKHVGDVRNFRTWEDILA